MLANNNLKVCWTLVKRDFRFHRAKNIVLALAAMLVTALYTFVFLMGSSVQDAFLLNYQYTYGSTSHILYTGLTEHQADLLSQHVNVKSTVRLSTLGQLSDPMIGQRSVKLAVTDQDLRRDGALAAHHRQPAGAGGANRAGRADHELAGRPASAGRTGYPAVDRPAGGAAHRRSSPCAAGGPARPTLRRPAPGFRQRLPPS